MIPAPAVVDVHEGGSLAGNEASSVSSTEADAFEGPERSHV